MRYTISDPSLARAAAELTGFGFEVGEGGIPTEIKVGEHGCNARLQNGRLTICTETRVQVFFVLKELSDRFNGRTPEDCSVAWSAAFDDLAYMLDCSRNAVARPETLEALIRHLAVMGYNSLGLYMEDTFAVPAYPYFGYLRTPYTKEDIARVDAYAAQFGIELVPYIQALAHFNTLTRHAAMHDLFDVGDILLCGEERTYDFLEALIATCAENFTTRTIHIGMDEAYMIGRGRYYDLHGPADRFEIMTKHLARVLAICERHGLHPMMWSDMFFSLTTQAQYGDDLQRELAEKVPGNVELIYWDYYNLEEAHYAERLRKHAVFKNPIGFAGGAWKWVGFTPENRYSIAATAAAARACIKAGVKRFIVTGWGDNGGECSPFATLPALLYCARVNYGDFSTGEQFAVSFASLADMPLSDFLSIDLNNRLTDNPDPAERGMANRHLLYNDLLLGTLDTTVPAGTAKQYAAHARTLLHIAKQGGRWSYLFETQYRLARVLALKAELGIALRRAYREGNREELGRLYNRLKRLPSEIERFYRAFAAQWARENRPNGFDVQDLRIGGLKQRVYAAIEKLGAYLRSETEDIPELEERLLDRLGHGETFTADPCYGEGSWLAVTSVNVNG